MHSLMMSKLPVSPLMLTSSVIAFICILTLSACDTGFGEPCTLPSGDAVEQACSSPSVEQGEENGTTQSASATCALDNYPSCSTFLCLKYRGSNPYCSLKCNSNSECDGGVCCPLVGDCQAQQSGAEVMMSIESSENTCANGGDCYCIRSGDLGR